MIESGVPIPELKKGKAKYPVAELKVGESFFVEKRIDLSYWRKRLPKRAFTLRENGKGWRVWRTK